MPLSKEPAFGLSSALCSDPVRRDTGVAQLPT